MFYNKKFKELDNKIDILNKGYEDYTARFNVLDHSIKELQRELLEYLQYKKKKEGDDPFIEILSESFDEKTGLELKLDWNDAMINYLKRNGYRGQDDDEIIQKYVSDIFNEKKVQDAPNPIA